MTRAEGLQLDSVAVSHNGSKPTDLSEPAVEIVQSAAQSRQFSQVHAWKHMAHHNPV